MDIEEYLEMLRKKKYMIEHRPEGKSKDKRKDIDGLTNHNTLFGLTKNKKGKKGKKGK